MVFCGDGFELPKVSLFRVFAVVSLLEPLRHFNFEKHPTGAQLLSPLYLIFCSRLAFFGTVLFLLESPEVVIYCFSSLSLLLPCVLFVFDVVFVRVFS